MLSKASIKYLRDLAKNNNRDWFKEHKGRYDAVLPEVKTLLADMTEAFAKIDDIESSKFYRIYRDVRFSADKTPYNPSWRMSWTRRKPALRGGYFLGIMPDEVFVGCGFWNPHKDDLALIRSQIAADPDDMRSVLKDKSLVKAWGEMKGEQLKSNPRGYDKDHTAIDLLRYKQYLFSKTYPVSAVYDQAFAKIIINDFDAIRPFFDYMSYILTHDLNGEALN